MTTVTTTVPTKTRLDPDTIRRRFTRLTAIAALMTFLMITIGAITRVSGSGMGCGTHWPLCNGKIIPEFESIEVVIEKGHRLFALLVGLYGALVVVRAWQHYRNVPRIIFPALSAMFLFLTQSALGALTVWVSNQWVSVLLHLGNAMLLFAAFMVTWANAKYGDQTAAARERGDQRGIRLPAAELIVATVLVFCVAMVGAAVAGNDAAKACVGYPLCAGEIWPTSQGPLQVINMTHRMVVGALGLVLIMMLLQLRKANNPLLSRPLQWAFALYLAQCALGALIVLVNHPEFLGVVRALHVSFAAATWATMSWASAISWQQQQSSSPQFKPADMVASAITSS